MNLINSLSIGESNLQQKNGTSTTVLKSYKEDNPPTIKEECVHITVSGDKQSGYSFFYDNIHSLDEEMMYTFNPDGSATVISYAWGTKQEYPKGTFSELYSSLPETPENIDFKTAKNILKMNRGKAIMYKDAIQILQELNVQKLS